ncbi:MAG: phosphatidylserine decarboxylase [Alphaproteobacteria bacterium]|nr:phosphatidylserine decarboxylase [Alphaproteobacteria bacterium]
MKQNYTLPTREEIDAVKLNWRRYLLPAIHKEGVKILLWEFAILLFFDGLMHTFLHIGGIWYIGIPLLIFSYYFFRNPVRVSPKGKDLILAPADGIVSNITKMVPPKELDLGNKPLIRISTFMSVFNVHVNRSPVTGVVHRLNYRPGKFVNVADKDSEDNERQEISIIAENGQKIGVIQIAGLVAKRIYCPLYEKDKLTAGQIFGMIRFGSRLDVYLPEGVYPAVLPGQSMVAGETILADMSHLSKKKGEK